jgi:hypothetical protein
MLRVQACGVLNIRSLVLIVLDPSSTGYAHWCNQVLITLKVYELIDHVLSNAPPINDPAWDHMETIVLSWIFDMITSELQDIAKKHSVTARQVWRTIKNQVISNSEMCALHLDATFRNFVQGDHSVSNYCRKLKSMANSLADLGCTISDRNLVLNVLRGLNKRYDHLQAIITRNMLFPSFHKVQDDLVLEELTLDPNTAAPPLHAFYSNNTLALPPPALSRPLGNGGQGHDHGRFHKNDRGNSGDGGGRNAPNQGNKV